MELGKENLRGYTSHKQQYIGASKIEENYLETDIVLAEDVDL
ncbi:hypothetical protein [Seonamhaeicola aphaedonensis]|nr:hypothetical protein [Seonamhaeicola aphaedonensis]